LEQKSGVAFRERPLEAMNSPERLDELVTVTTARLWLALAGALVLAAVLAGWFAFGRVPLVVRGSGILLAQDGLLQVTSSEAGWVSEMLVQAGDRVAAGQILATLADEAATGGAARRQVRSPKAGRVVETIARAGAPAVAGTHLLTLAATGGEIRAFLFAPYSGGRRVRPGMQVQLRPAGGPAGESGSLPARVEYVSEFPASPAAMINLLQNPRLVERFSPRDEPPLMIRARLLDGAGGSPPARGVPLGTLCDARIVLREIRPYQLVFDLGGQEQ